MVRLAVWVAGFSLCSGVGVLAQAPGNRAGAAAPAQAEEPARPANYQLVPGDTVSIRVFRESDLDTTQRLSKDGTVNLPFLGVVRVVGKTTNEASAMIAALLDKDYVVHPQVSVSVINYLKQKYTVIGQVNAPGSFDIPEEQTVDILTAIARAGGFTRLARQNKVIVRRFTEGREQTITVDVKRMIEDKNVGRFLIQPNDSINVLERFI